ncbi:MAG: PEP-CTERM sorting domain-containing protein [Nitrospirae bacterium]|nr:PEP-CTERM sorting domain-containing protein [Nitrospirota bacterium]
MMHKLKLSLFVVLLLLFSVSASFAAAVSYVEISQGSYDHDSTSGTMPFSYTGTDSSLTYSDSGKIVLGSDAYYWMEREYQSSTGSVSYNSYPSGLVPSAVVVTPGHSATFASGYSDAATRTLRGNAAIISNGATNAPYISESISKSDLSNSFTVGAGSSNLANGDTARIRLSFRLDGFLSATGRSWPETGHAYPEMMAGLTIRDTSTRERVVMFDANAKIDAGPVNINYWPYSYSSDLDWAWGVSTNTGVYQVQRDSNNVTSIFLDATVDHNFGFDTGVLDLVFDVIVGNTYSLFEYLSVYNSAYGIASSLSDFSSTFGPVIVNDNGTGVLLAWELGDLMNAPVNNSAVPEPSTFILFGAGLVGAALIRRRITK